MVTMPPSLCTGLLTLSANGFNRSREAAEKCKITTVLQLLHKESLYKPPTLLVKPIAKLKNDVEKVRRQ